MLGIRNENRSVLLLAAFAFIFSACSSELPHEAAYDPASAASKQAKASFTATVELEGESDFSQVTVELANRERTYSVDTKSDGKVELAGIVPGAYRLSIHSRYFEPYTAPVQFELAGRIDLGTIELPVSRSTVKGVAKYTAYEGEDLVEGGGVNVALTKVASLRAVGDVTGATVEFQAVSDSAGNYSIPSVPSGEYKLTASSANGSLVVEGIVVGGEPTVSVREVSVPELSGTFTVVDANGLPISLTSAATAQVQIFATGASQVALGTTTGSAAGCTWNAPQSLQLLTTLALPGVDGKYSVCVRLIDALGNQSKPMLRALAIDRTAPSPFYVQALSNNGYVTEAQVTLSITAADAGSGIAELATAPTALGLAAAAWRPYQAVFDESFLSDGAKTIWLRIRDQAGNMSAARAVTVTVDRSSPTGGVLIINGGAALTNQRQVTLAIGAAGATYMQVSETNSFAGAVWEPYQPSKEFELSNSQGLKTVFVRFKDDAGWETAAVSDSITLDTVAPASTSFQINANTALTKDSIVTLTQTAGEATLDMRHSERGDMQGAVWRTFASPVTFTLSSGDEPKTVYLQLRDPAGNLSTIVSDSITLDRTAPTGRVSILNGATFANATDGKVQLQFTVDSDASGIQWVRISNTNVNGDLDGAGALPYTSEKQWTLTPNGSGYDENRTVYVKFLDGAGNATATAVTDSVRYDTAAPVAGGTPIRINGGALYATSTLTTLTLSATGASEMQLANEGTFSGANWEPFKSQIAWFLEATEGQRSVAVKFRDAAGNVIGSYSDSITLDTVRPSNPSVAINFGATYASAVTVDLSLFAVGATHMQISNDGVFDSEPVEGYAAAKTWTLATGDGVKAVAVRFLDLAGNASDPVADYIILDTTPPSSTSGSIVIDGGAQFSNDPAGAVSLTLSSAEATTVYLSESGCETGGAWYDYATTRQFNLSLVQGAHTVYAVFRDIAGNKSPCVSDGIVLDTVLYAPTLAVSLEGPEAVPGKTKSQTVTVNFAGATTDIAEWRVSNDGGFLGGSWAPFVATSSAWTLAPNDGNKTVYVELRDAAGNQSATLMPSIVLDQTGPAVPALAVVDVNSDGQAVSSAEVELQWSIPSDADLVGFELERYVASVDTTYGLHASPAPNVSTYADDVTATAGAAHYYRIRALDSLGNASGWSVSVVAQPFEPIGKIKYKRTVDGYIFDVTPNSGTFDTNAIYTYNSNALTGIDQSVALVNNLFEHATPFEWHYDEYLTLRTSNQDNSLVYDSVFALPGRWQETVYGDGRTGYGADAVVDSNDKLHIIHSSGNGGSLYYANKVTGEWFNEFLNLNGNNPAIAVDANGKAHVLFGGTLGNHGTLNYLTNESGSWVSTQIGNGGQPDLAIAPDGYLHGVFYSWDGSQWDLHYATNEGGSGWTVTKIYDNIAWQETSIAVGRDGTIHTAFMDDASGFAYYGSRPSGGSWTFEIADSDTAQCSGIWLPCQLGQNIKVAVDYRNDAWIAYSVDGQYVRVSQCCAWYYETVADIGEFTWGMGIDFTIDPWGQPHVFFRRDTGEFSDIHYAHKISFDQWGWKKVLTYLPGSVSLAASDRYLHWVFQDDKSDLIHIEIDTPDGNKTRLQENLKAGAFAQATDGTHRMVNVYDQAGDDIIEIQSDASGTWTTTATLAGETYGDGEWMNPVMTIDEGGVEHLFFVDANNNNLVYYDSSVGSLTPITAGVDNWISPVVTSRGAGDVAAVFMAGNGLYVMWRENGGAWNAKLLQTGYDSDHDGHFVSIDNAGVVHVIYADYYFNSGTLFYVNNQGGTWQWTTLQAYFRDSLLNNNAIYVDDAGRVHVLFGDYHEYDTKYYKYENGTWTMEVQPVFLSYPRILEESGQIHFVYDGGYQYRNRFGEWERINFSYGNTNIDYVAMMHDGKLEVAYFDYWDYANVLIDDILGEIPVQSIQAVQAQ